jgi:hypothetical protein
MAVDDIWDDTKPEGFTPSCDVVIGSRDAIVDCSELMMVFGANLTSELIPRLLRMSLTAQTHTRHVRLAIDGAKLPYEAAAEPNAKMTTIVRRQASRIQPSDEST